LDPGFYPKQFITVKSQERQNLVAEGQEAARGWEVMLERKLRC
jgi:hypothetical protein